MSLFTVLNVPLLLRHGRYWAIMANLALLILYMKHSEP